MASPLSLLVLFPFIFTAASSLTCTTQKVTDAANRVYANCVDLPALDSFLHWTHDAANASLAVAFLAAPPSPGGWVSWGINPTGTGMAGAQVLAAYSKSGGAVTVKTLDLKSYSVIVPGKLSVEVWGVRGEEVGGVIRIFANVKVKGESVNHVWQVGPSVTAGRLDKHDFAPANLNSKGTLSLNGKQTATAKVDAVTTKKNIHGILNAVSWGVLFPLGVIIARYLRTFPSADPIWFYLHAGCQVSAYAIGVAGWATGLKLGSESVGIQYSNHRNIGITLFCFATLQIFALFLRPVKEHKYRYIWNIYHHGIGYSVIILGIVNIFLGFNILNPEKKWKSTYSAVLIALGALAVVLEVITWIVVLKRKSNKSTKTYNNGENRQQPLNM
ncbi:cytochrome b561 and DOMON domain-containing protein At4g12980 [Cajanus cajan]|uniref:Cytochrome b561 and DOMON domain-containing protein n=1 Tax=Cajanus cajan TaxID=3821 RepID=A0A151RNQ8_CAJCA|nr:cytochrome b561 and DOMON domain-containing protein At4g12980 [Cajanus cajan]KYP44123.1 Auxin-induced in root cultures protein 12 [Cajanus cajan]